MNLEQPFIENDETNAVRTSKIKKKSDMQEQWTSYKWVMQDSTMCWYVTIDNVLLEPENLIILPQ